MVRVITVHNFSKQEITPIDEATDVAVAPPDILLLALPNNTILVRDLTDVNDAGYTIPTVDQVVKIIYSIQGNYIATLENKVTRNGVKVSYVRVYLNWESLKVGRDLFPMRARIAGRVTPLSQNQQGLEMIEITTHKSPDNISCCSVSGNLLLSSRNVLTIYSFVTQVHDISKIHFIDFKQLPVDLHLSFIPTRHQLVEDVIAAQNDEYLHIFRIKSAVPMCSLTDKEFSIDDFERVQTTQQKSTKKYKTIHYEQLLEEIEQLKYLSTMSITDEVQRKIAESPECELSKVNLSSFPLRHDFPTIRLENSHIDSRGPDVLWQGPFALGIDLTVNLVNKSSSDNFAKVQYKAINICQYHLMPLTIGNVTNREIQEKFNSLILRPYYVNEKNQKGSKQRLFESDYYSNLKCIACFFGTQQEGYLHCFEYETIANEDVITCGKYTTYAFTAPVIDVQLDDCFVHAITELGLETYTMRAAKHLMKKSDSTECPSSKDPVCLIGLHPFVNVLRMCITNNYLTLFANNEESSWTLYQLKSPDTSCVWKDFLSPAEENKWESPSTYCELLGEAHLILKTRVTTSRWITQKDLSKNQLSFASHANRSEDYELVESLYKESCALLGDYHIMNKNHQATYSYYTMSGYKIANVTKRVRGLWESIPEQYRKCYNEKEITKGLINFLKRTLSLYDQKYYEFLGNREEFYNPEIGNLVTTLMDLLEKEERTSISDLVLESVVLREFSTDRILKMLKSLLSESSAPQDKDALSLALMCIQRDQCDQAKTVLLTMTPSHLEALLLQYYDLLFANHSSSGTNIFTELSMVLIEIYPNVLAMVLSNLVMEKRLLSLVKVLNFFMDLIPSSGILSKNSSLVLQIVLENYFKYYTENFSSRKYDHKTTEAMKILIRIYLTRLLFRNVGDDKNNEEESTSDILFYKWRSKYLDQIPPFGPDFTQILMPQDVNSPSQMNLEEGQKTILLKIQSLLCFKELPDECLAEVRLFLAKQSKVSGCLSLQVLCAESIQQAVTVLIDSAPQALREFSKERVSENNDWKFLIARLRKKIDEANEDARNKFYFQQILYDILHHLVEHLTIRDITDILPPDFEDFQKYVSIAQRNAQANHIKTLIMITGKQLLATL